MAGFWTKKGIDKIKTAIANNQELTFTGAKVNISNRPIGSIEVNPLITELPNAWDFNLVPVLEYDQNTGVLFADVTVPPMSGSPTDVYVNGVGLYIDDTLAYVAQFVPRRLSPTGYTKFRIKVNLENYQSAFDITLVGFSYNAGEEEEVTLDENASHTRTFAGTVKDVQVLEKNSDGTYSPTTDAKVTISSDLKSVTVQNTSSASKTFRIFYLIGVNPIPDNITVDDIKKIGDTVYVGSQPPAPTDGYKLFYYPDAFELYFANTNLNRWESITSDLRTKLNFFWDKVLVMHALDLSGLTGLYNYEIFNPKDWEGIDQNSSTNVVLYKDAYWLERWKGDAVLTLETMTVDNPSLQFAIDVITNRPNQISVTYDTGSGEKVAALRQVIKESGVSTITFKIKSPYSESDFIDVGIFGIVIVANQKLNFQT